MKIKIVEAGWAGYTGPLGPVEFVDGVSVDDVSKGEMRQLSGIIQFEDADTGSDPSLAQELIDSQNVPAPLATVPTTEQIGPVMPEKVWTNDELVAIADAHGIKGIREVATPMGLKGTSIAELIGKILSVQAEQVKAFTDAEAKKAEGAEPAAE